MKMWLGKPWIRFLIIIVGVATLWLYIKYWDPFVIRRNDSVQVIQSEKGTINLSEEQLDVKKVVITVYYEALCSDSRGFILRKLEPTYEKISDNVIIKLIPYGKATTSIGPNGEYVFKCQHEARECEANMIHACAIEYIKDPGEQLHFISCMIDRNLWPIDITHECAKKMNIDPGQILTCAKSTMGSILLAKYGEMTNALKPPVTYIPTVTLDEDSGNQEAILMDLLREVCKHFKSPLVSCT